MLLVCLGSSGRCLDCSFLLLYFLIVLWMNSFGSHFVVMQLRFAKVWERHVDDVFSIVRKTYLQELLDHSLYSCLSLCRSFAVLYDHSILENACVVQLLGCPVSWNNF